MKYQITIQLKKEILDPEARAIQSALTKNDFSDLKEVSISRQYTLELDEKMTNPLEKIEDITKNHLSNPLSETYSIKRLEP